jgi:outer membrane protein with beta-barrel domain
MRDTVRAVIILALTLGAGAAPLAAQNPGLPVYNLGVPRGIGLYGDLGFPNDVAGKGTAYGVTGRAGFGDIGVTATLSADNPKGDAGSDVAVGGTLNYRLLGGPLVPLSVTLQAGASYSKPGENFVTAAVGFATVPDPVAQPVLEHDLYHFPIGIGFALVIPNPVLAIHPWLAPRVDIVHTKASGISDTETNFGLSGGLEFNLLNGFGIQAAYDRVFVKDAADPATFGVGAHYTFRVPGL